MALGFFQPDVKIVGGCGRLFQSLLGLADLLGQCVILLLSDGTCLELFGCLSACLLESVEALSRELDLLVEQFLLFDEELGVGRIELELFLDRLELSLCALELGVNAFQCLLQPCGVASDLDCYAFDISCHYPSILRRSSALPLTGYSSPSLTFSMSMSYIMPTV